MDARQWIGKFLTFRSLTKKKEKKRTFAIFLDYKNLEDGLSDPIERFRNFSWLIDPILNKGTILYGFCFIPEHYFTRAPVMQLSHRHGFQIVVCPRQITGVVTKDADTVDYKMTELARTLIEHDDFTDLVIISGDADFVPLARQARWYGKRVTVVSAALATSGRFLDIQVKGKIEVKFADRNSFEI